MVINLTDINKVHNMIQSSDPEMQDLGIRLALETLGYGEWEHSKQVLIRLWKSPLNDKDVKRELLVDIQYYLAKESYQLGIKKGYELREKYGNKTGNQDTRDDKQL